MLSRIRLTCITLTRSIRSSRCFTTDTKSVNVRTPEKYLLRVVYKQFPVLEIHDCIYHGRVYLPSYLDERMSKFSTYIPPSERTLPGIEKVVKKKCIKRIIDTSNFLNFDKADMVIGYTSTLLEYSKYIRKVGPKKFRIDHDHPRDGYLDDCPDPSIFLRTYNFQKVSLDKQQIELFRNLYVENIWLPLRNMKYLYDTMDGILYYRIPYNGQ